MLTFSRDPQVAERQMQAIIFYLTTFGYIDGDFDASEKDFVRDYIRKLVERRVATGLPDADEKLRAELTQRFTTHFHEVFEGIDRAVSDLFTEAVSAEEDQNKFVHARLKLRCFEIFKSFDERGQEELMETVDELIHADGQVHPAELEFRNELSALLEEDLSVELVDGGASRPSIEVRGPRSVQILKDNHPFFAQFEHHYSRAPELIAKQVGADRALIEKTVAGFDAQRRAGAGKLTGKKKVDELAGEESFLDGHVYAMWPRPGRTYEVTVLGDLHGCYSNLKAALLQARFFERVAAFRADPEKHPEPKLVLLGDYIDRGLFSMNGVLRTVMQIFATAPEHVYVLRGNHEYYIEFKGQVYGGVKPAESINTLKPHLPIEVFRDYMRLFDAMPNMLLFGRILLVHGGIPRDLLLKERYRELSSLNDPDMRFQMMWSDPSSADVIPAALQEQSARFPFGRLQATAFLQRMGCHTLIRGHEKVDAGFKSHYDDENVCVCTVFSAGGATNDDLPADSSYRSVSPMALTLDIEGDDVKVTPWLIDYERYNDPDRNSFFKAPPEIEHRLE